MSKKCKLIMVAADANNNKYYNMEENSDGTFTSSFGRVGHSPQRQNYPISDWDRIYKAKIKKGYKDVTSYRQVGTLKDVDDPKVSFLLSELNRYSRVKVVENYSSSTEDITKVQLDDAQGLVDEISNNKEDLRIVNDNLLKLYTILPRQMRNVRDHLLNTVSDVLRKIREEQDLLDNLRTQVSLVVEGNDQTLLDALGIQITPLTDEETFLLTDLFGKHHLHFMRNYLLRGFRVENPNTRTAFNSNLEAARDKTVALRWHGSRNSNFLSILSQGLRVRPSNVSYNGGRWGAGIYSADDFNKSLQYTEKYMAVFSVHLGKQYVSTRDEPNLNYDKISKSGYDSVLANVNPKEYIVYKSEQVTVEYFLQIR